MSKLLLCASSSPNKRLRLLFLQIYVVQIRPLLTAQKVLIMGKKKKVEQSNYLKIGDTVLLYYNTRGKDGDPRKSGYVTADLSG